MGLLTGGYLKMFSARMRLQLQNQLTRVSMRYMKVQKQVGEMEKRLTTMQQQQNSVFNAQMQQANAGAYANIFKGLGNLTAADGTGQVDATKSAQIQAANLQYQQAQQYNSVFYTMQKFNADETFEQFRTMQLEPLQQLEESLAVEKANLESRLATVKEQEESAKKMEQDSRKDVIPDYTGQG